MIKKSVILVLFLLTGSLLIISGLKETGKESRQTVIPKASSQSAVLGEGDIATESSSLGYLAHVERVVDGDTIEVDYQGKPTKLRYTGVDTPETVDPRRGVGCFGKEASSKNKELVEGKDVYLESDVTDTDRFGRILRYVYLKLKDGQTLFVNDYLVRAGFAKIDTIPPNVKYQDRFLEAQKEAQSKSLGLWSPQTCNGKTK